MKKVVLVLVLMTGLSAMAQRHGHRNHKKKAMPEMSVEQIATLKTKKMVLTLDLSEKQQQQVMEINLENAEFRKTKMAERKAKKEELQSLTSDERFQLENAMLDRRIVQQEKMKEILTDEQYLTWKKLNLAKYMHGKKRMQRNGRG